MKKLSVCIFMFSVLCCSKRAGNNDSPVMTIENKDSVTNLISHQNCLMHNKEEQSSKNNNITDYIGDWQSLGDENVTFRIDEGKIYYYDTDQEFKCRIDGDSLYIYYDEDSAPSSFYTVLKEDTMICGEEEYRYVRVK